MLRIMSSIADSYSHHLQLAMLNNSAERARLLLADRFNAAFPKGGSLSDADIGAACGVTKAAPGGWRHTGRIAKRHLPVLAELSGKPLAWWLTGEIPAACAASADLTAEEVKCLTAFRGLPEHRRDLYRAQIVNEYRSGEPPPKVVKDRLVG